jgi:hypothetical protein
MLAALLIALALLIAAPPAAEATYPGKNGDLLVTWHGRSHQDTTTDILRISPGSGHETWIPVCRQAPLGGYPEPFCVEGGAPAVSPDGGSIAIATVDFNPSQPYVYGASVRVLTFATGTWSQIRLADTSRVANTYEPLVRWAPGPAFLLAPSRGGVFSQDGLFLVGTDGATRGEPAPSGMQPDVSADGRIVFVRRGSIQIVETDGTVRTLTGKGGYRPSWSPHGKSIAFNRKGWIYTMPAAGGRARRITRGAEPCWSPDGKLIAFFRPTPNLTARGRARNVYLYVVNRRTGHVRQVSSRVMANVNLNDGTDDGIDWQPAR